MKRKFLTTGTLGLGLLIMIGLSACGGSDSGVGHMKTHDRNISKKEFDISTISWEFQKADGFKVHLGEDALYLSFEHQSTQPNMQFFLDVDNNPNTGLLKEGGAEYVVENGYLYEHTTENVWGWKEISMVPTSVIKDREDAVKIPLELLKNRTTTMRLNAQALDSSWMPKVFAPAPLGDKYTYPE